MISPDSARNIYNARPTCFHSGMSLSWLDSSFCSLILIQPIQFSRVNKCFVNRPQANASECFIMEMMF
jgi:hypothetical protein